MVILTDKEIQDFISKNQLIIGSDNQRVKSSSYDMRIGTIFRDGDIINASHKNGQKAVIVKPGEVVTMLTLEELKLPDNIAATAYAMNSQSLNGFLVLNPGHVDPGYSGTLSIKAINLRKVNLPLYIDSPIFTVVFQKLESGVSKPYPGTKSRREREQEVNDNEIEKSMKSIADLMSFTPEDINKLITNHWTTKFYNTMAIAAALFSALQFFQKPDASKETIKSQVPVINITNSIPAQTDNTKQLEQKQNPLELNSSNTKKIDK